MGCSLIYRPLYYPLKSLEIYLDNKHALVLVDPGGDTILFTWPLTTSGQPWGRDTALPRGAGGGGGAGGDGGRGDERGWGS